MERVFVAGSSAFTIREAAGFSAGTLTVTITQDDRLEWTYQLASWRPLAVGSGFGSAAQELLDDRRAGRRGTGPLAPAAPS
jgi:hypothetical protein